MSAAARAARAKATPATGPDGGTPTGDMELSGVVRTSRGYAVAQALVKADGSVTVTLGPSQAYPEHVAHEHKRVAVNAALRAQGSRRE